MAKTPTQEQVDTAISWLRCNEGDNGEAERCAAVADWLDDLFAAKHLAKLARDVNVPVAALRRKIAEKQNSNK